MPFIEDKNFSNASFLSNVSGEYEMDRLATRQLAAYAIFFLACLSAATFVIVSNVLFIVACSKTRALRTIATKHIHSLAMADMTLGLAMYLQGAYYISINNNGNLHSFKNLCLFIKSTVSVGLTSSLFSVMLIAIDRYIYIVHPFRYTRFVTARKTTVAIVIAWMLSILYGTVPVYFHNFNSEAGCNHSYSSDQSYPTSRLAIFLVAVSISGYCHISIQCTAMKHIRKLYPPELRKLRQRPNAVQIDQQTTNAHCHMIASMKLVKSFLLVYILFVYAWLPGLVAYTMGSKNRILLSVLAIVAEFSTCLNVLVYVFSNQQFKNAIVKVVKCSSSGSSTFSSGFSVQGPSVIIHNNNENV